MMSFAVMMISATTPTTQSSSTSTNGSTPSTNTIAITCPTDNEMVYNFKSSTLLGTQPHLQNVASIKKGSAQENTLMGQMTFTCAGTTTTNDNKKKTLVLVQFPSAQFLQFQGMKKYGNMDKKDVAFWFGKKNHHKLTSGTSSTLKNEKHVSNGFGKPEVRKYRVLNKRQNLATAMNKFPTAVVRNSNGQITQMIFHKEEPKWVKSVKKGILRMLTTETNKAARNQTDGFGGKYAQKYNKKVKKNDKVAISQSFSHKDFKKIPLQKKHLNYEGSHIVTVNKKGLITKALFGTRISLGKRELAPIFQTFEKKYGKKQKFTNKSGKEQIQALHVGKVVLKHIKKQNKVNVPKIVSTFFEVKNGSVAIKPAFIIEKTFGITKADKKEIRKLVKKQFKPVKLIKMLKYIEKKYKPTPEMNKKLTKVAEMVRKNPIKAAKILIKNLEKGVEKLNKLLSSDEKAKSLIPFLESIQTLIATINSTKIQDKLVEVSKTHPVLTKNYIYSSVFVKNPTKQVHNFVKSLADSDENAFLAYADLADRLKDKSLIDEIVSEILNKMKSASSADQLVSACHALNNAGRGVPLSIIKHLILSESIPSTIKSLVADNLKKRGNDTRVDDLIHFLVNHKKLDANVIASLISCQTTREGLHKNGTSVCPFTKLLKHTKNDLIKQAIHTYLYTVGNKEAADAMEMSFQEEINAFTTHSLAQSAPESQPAYEEPPATWEPVSVDADEETKARNRVEEVAYKIKSIFSAANWNGAQASCVPASRSEQICVYNTEMMNFINKQGDLSNMAKAKYYSYENKFGTQGVNLYTGILVYGGANFQCTKESAFDVVFFGRAAAEANIFDSTYPVASAYVELNNRSPSSINNRVYVKIFTTTFVDKPFLPSFSTCNSETKNILTKAIPSLFKTSYTMAIGPVPITFSIGAGLTYGVDFKYGYCLNSFSASTSLEPTVTIDITGSADIGIPLAKASIQLRASSTSRGIPELSFESCNLCARMKFNQEAASFTALLHGKVALWEKSWNLYQYNLPQTYSKTLYEQCVSTKLQSW
ncbi:hypothetical protein C9374_013447 [Naegleria lovaniensis]|uniref:Vitellogenin domain-containing protein n=1 Tax=Naegleria lovaniensis TaxID=51637 RepID=A0AA88H277_NAELO|nr:uncharacterized protein C9374_013447 [Naegleria lovaniensis]KAG2391962.1 hypothetical protein C9374_013447 [Naegleria lovaniensis]